MNKLLKYLFLFSISVSLHGQYISEVLEYLPAPSQYMNAAPWGTPSGANSIVGGIDGHVSLGSFGGYIIFKFENPVENDPDNPFGVDFTIFGNPLPNWSEPGIVSVMKDENGNGLVDDTWYEIAGSDHYFSSTIKGYEVAYQNPGGLAATDVPWSDNYNQSGVIKANAFYPQSYYPLRDSFPEIDTLQYSLSGTLIKSTVDTAFEESIFSLKRGFGYVDNQFRGKAPYTIPDNPYTAAIENSGGDAFDIAWAVDSNDNPIDLDMIHFVKVHSSVMDGAGWLGQISTEILGAVDVAPDHSIHGNDELIIIKEIPLRLDTTSYQIEVFAFRKGKLQTNERLQWTSNMPEASVDENNILHVNTSGELMLTAMLASNQDIKTSVSTTVDLSVASSKSRFLNTSNFTFYPNPANDYIYIQCTHILQIKIIDVSGKIVFRNNTEKEINQLDISALPQGIYFIHAFQEEGVITKRFIKN